MKFVIVICAFVLSVQCAPQVVPNFEMSENGEYRFGYETPDGQTRYEEGILQTRTGEDGRPVPVIVVTGRYSYVGDDGLTHFNEYVADENGFRPQVGSSGNALPIRPTIPTLPTLRPTPFRPLRPLNF